MAELTINTADITAALRKNLEGFKPDLVAAQVGRVLEVGDGIATVGGHTSARDYVCGICPYSTSITGAARRLDDPRLHDYWFYSRCSRQRWCSGIARFELPRLARQPARRHGGRERTDDHYSLQYNVANARCDVHLGGDF